MKIIIHRGTHQIGGCVTEIQSNRGTRIAIDIGENLPSQEEGQAEELSIEGLTTEGKNNFKAIFITHYHGDHIGLYNKILPQIPVYIGKVSKEIFSILQEHLVKAKMLLEQNLALIDQFKTYQIPQKISVDDITITPIEVDHSAFNAHMFLIEADGKRVLHTGDFRIHGQRGSKVLEAIEKYVGQVDCLICEGTTLSREKKSCMTENELQRKAKEIFQDNQYTFVMCSSTNIDRIAAIHKATLQADKLFICDKYQKEILMYIDSIARSDLYKFQGKVLSYDDNILEKMKEKGFVMLVRDNYISKEVMKKFTQSTFVYSEWEGYLNPEFTEYKKMQEFVPKDAIHLHTSGHADYEAIKSVCKLVKPKVLIPIHGENPAEFKEMRIRRVRNKRDTRQRRNYDINKGERKMRKIDNKFKELFKENGELAPIIEFAKQNSDDVFLGIRDNEIHLYVNGGGRFFKLKLGKKQVEIDPKYLEKLNIKGNQIELDKALKNLNKLKTAVKEYEKNIPEKKFKQELITQINTNSNFYAYDIEYRFAPEDDQVKEKVTKKPQPDLMIISKPDKNGRTSIFMMEIKYGKGSFAGANKEKHGSGIAGHINGFMDIIRWTKEDRGLSRTMKEKEEINKAIRNHFETEVKGIMKFYQDFELIQNDNFKSIDVDKIQLKEGNDAIQFGFILGGYDESVQNSFKKYLGIFQDESKNAKYSVKKLLKGETDAGYSYLTLDEMIDFNYVPYRIQDEKNMKFDLDSNDKIIHKKDFE